MANNKYKAMNLDEFAGISKSLFTATAMIPKMKNSRAGLVRFSSNN
jgi:hypothetical protein